MGMMTKTQRFTPLEQRLIDSLSDGKPHCQKELIKAVDDTGLMSVNQLRVYLCGLRKKLPEGQAILSTIVNRKRSYQHVRLLNSPYDGRA